MKKYTKVTANNVKKEFSLILKSYIGPKSAISYKQAARELEIEERTLGSWVRGEKQLNLSNLLKLSTYLPRPFIEQVLTIPDKLE